MNKIYQLTHVQFDQFQTSVMELNGLHIGPEPNRILVY